MLTRFLYFYFHPLLYYPFSLGILILGCYFLSIGRFFFGIAFILFFVSRFQKKIYENISEWYGDRFSNSKISLLIFCHEFLETKTFEDIYNKLTQSAQIASDLTAFKESVLRSLEQTKQELWAQVRSNIPHDEQWDSSGAYYDPEREATAKKIGMGLPFHFKIFQGRTFLNGKLLEDNHIYWQVHLSDVYLAFRLKVDNGVLKFQIGSFEEHESIVVYSGKKATASLRWCDITSFPLLLFPSSLGIHHKFLNMGSSNFEEFYLFCTQDDRSSLKKCRKVHSKNAYKLFLYEFFPSVEEIFSDKLGLPWRLLTWESGLLDYRHEFLLREKFVTKEDYLGRFDDFGFFKNSFMKIRMTRINEKRDFRDDYNLRYH